ncbi:MAG: hypothetical protein QXI11_09280, partial [Thermoproteota archaeon]
ESKPNSIKIKPAAKPTILLGRRRSSSPPNNALKPSTTKKAVIAPEKTETAEDLEDSIIVHI